MSEDSISFDSVLGLCQHQYRRIVLGTLIEEQRSLTLNDLTKTVFEYNHQTPITETSEDDLTEIRTSLHHAHLPKLAAAGLINYDSERQLVEPLEQLEQVQPTLSTILDADPSLETPMAPGRHTTTAQTTNLDSDSTTSTPSTTPNDRDTVTDSHDEIVHRELDTDREDSAIAIVEVVADLEGTPVHELPPTYNCIGGMLSELYSNPPAPETQVTVEFTYSGYRITVEQSGAVEFVRTT